MQKNNIKQGMRGEFPQTNTVNSNKTPWYKDIEEVTKRLQITSKSEIPPEIPIVKFNGALFVKQGSFGVISGKQKSGKSTTLEVIIVESLRRKGSPIVDNLGLEVEPANENKVLVIDTEQSPQDVQDSVYRINRALGRTEGDDDPRLVYIGMREVDTLEEVKEATNTLISETSNLHLVIIDGIADLIADPFSDATGARTLVRSLMKLTSVHNFAMILAIHENYRDVKLTGHLGTELSKKTMGVLTLKKMGNYHELSASTLRRSQDPEPSYFMKNLDGGVYSIDSPKHSNNADDSKPSPKTVKYHTYLEAIFHDSPELPLKTVRERLKQHVLTHESDRYTDPSESRFKTYVSSSISTMMCDILKPVEGKKDIYEYSPVYKVS